MERADAEESTGQRARHASGIDWGCMEGTRREERGAERNGRERKEMEGNERK